MDFPKDKENKIDNKYLNLLMDVHIISSVDGEKTFAQIETSRR